LTTFVDTSAVLALLDADDSRHSDVDATWSELILSKEKLVSSNYVLVELLALLQRRLGMDAVKAIQGILVPLLDIEWIDTEIHGFAMEAFLKASRRRLSLVDCTSFEVMRRRGIRRAFAVDGHFPEHGFEQIPPDTESPVGGEGVR
jgi:predicted nucleic acid-binding protein